MSEARYLIGDVFQRLAEIPDGSIDLIVTSPPFLALRSYLPADHPDKGKEIGSEPTPAAFLSTLLALTVEWRRVLAPHGSLCVELGDTYSGGEVGTIGAATGYDALRKHQPHSETRTNGGRGPGWPLDKSLCLLPTLYPASLAYGRNLLTGEPCEPWRIRNLIVWHRPNPPVGALGDKVRPSTSYITVACTSRTRWFDLDAERTAHQRADNNRLNTRQAFTGARVDDGQVFYNNGNEAGAPPLDCWLDATTDDVWTIPTAPYKGSHYACVDDQTEALTLTGWKSHEDLVDGETIAAYDATMGVLGWEPATFHRYPFDGELVAINQRETVQRLTPNHRTLIRTVFDTERTIEAANLRSSHRLPVAAPFAPGGEPVRPSWAALCGWFVAEGHLPKPGREPRAMIYQSESANPQHVTAIRDLLINVNAQWTENRREREWRGRPSVEIVFTVRGRVAELLRSFGKHIPNDVLLWDDLALTAFMDALIDGDGHRRASGRAQFITKNESDADMFQAIACRLGKRSTISERQGGCYSVTIGERSWVSLRGTNGASKVIGGERYEGVVWCPSVPSTYWLARRNGRPFITGNTFPIALPRKLINLMCPRQVCVTCGEPRRRIVELEPGAGGYHQGNNGGTTTGGTLRLAREATTLGWSDCGHDNYRRGRVLDPFCGSGTTLVAASELGRDSIGIDIDARNLDLARQRCGMFLIEDEPAEVAL